MIPYDCSMHELYCTHGSVAAGLGMLGCLKAAAAAAAATAAVE